MRINFIFHLILNGSYMFLNSIWYTYIGKKRYKHLRKNFISCLKRSQTSYIERKIYFVFTIIRFMVINPA